MGFWIPLSSFARSRLLAYFFIPLGGIFFKENNERAFLLGMFDMVVRHFTDRSSIIIVMGVCA
jgi:hypothetical protein